MILYNVFLIFQVINKTEVTDGGKYSCIMTNKVGSTEVVFDVTVQKPPSIAANVGANIVEGHVVALKRSIVLKCEADGQPMPKISWLKVPFFIDKTKSLSAVCPYECLDL